MYLYSLEYFNIIEVMAGKTTLTEERVKIIEQLLKAGLDIQYICKALKVSDTTFYKWKTENVMGLHDIMLTISHEKLLDDAKEKLKDLIHSEDDNVSAKVSIFLAETLGKKHFSKDTAQTINIVLPQPILDLGLVPSTTPEKALLNKDNKE